MEKEQDMQLWEHLEELRWAFFKILGTLVVTTAAALCFVNRILYLFMLPIEIIKSRNPEIVVQQILTSPFDGVMIKMKISFLLGLIIALPLIIYFLWGFVKPGLKDNERKIFTSVCLLGTFAFVLGVICGYFLINNIFRV